MWKLKLLAVLALGAQGGFLEAEAPFLRGDVDGDGSISLSDAVHLIRSLQTRSALTCPDAADFNDNGDVNLGDVALLIEHILTGEPTPAPPYSALGIDPTEDLLGCEALPQQAIENGGVYSVSVQSLGENLRFRVSLENTVPVVGGVLSLSLPDNWSRDSTVVDVNPSLELSTFLSDEHILTGKVRADRMLTTAWLLDFKGQNSGLSPGNMRALFDVILCPATTPAGDYLMKMSDEAELIEEGSARRIAQVQEVALKIERVGSTCVDLPPAPRTVRAYSWMPDAVARVGEVFRVPFRGMANREHKYATVRMEWDLASLRVIGIEKVRGETTLFGFFSNWDGFDSAKQDLRHEIEAPYYQVIYCDPCNNPPHSRFYALVSVRNYHWSKRPDSDLIDEVVLYPGDKEFHHFDLVLQVLPTAQEGQTWIRLEEDPTSFNPPSTLGDTHSENRIFFKWFDPVQQEERNVYIRPRPLWESRVTILPGAPPTAFVRGDVNLDGELSLTDVVTLLSNLFLGSTFIIRCPDSADMNDDGLMDVSDAVGVLGFLFLGHEQPEPPYPFPGNDPTEDSLPCGQ